MNSILQPVDDLLNQQATQITSLNSTITDLNQKITDLQNLQSVSSAPIVFTGLEKNPEVGSKTLMKWWQPGNTGNTGGGSTAKHGSFTWSPSDIGTIFAIKPANISPKSDNFFNMLLLPYPEKAPRRLRWSASDYSALSPTDWNNSQQMEFQIEIFWGGFQYTCGWAVNPHSGLFFWGAADKWVLFDKTINSLAEPTCINAEFYLDTSQKTFNVAWISMNGRMISVDKTVKALASSHSNEFSVAVQLDGKASAPAYSARINNLSAEYE